MNGREFFSANVPANVRRTIMSISGNDKVADDGW
jgi:hypothetical protein